MKRNANVMSDSTPPPPDHTCAHSYHSDYSEANLPPILFCIERLTPGPRGQVEDLLEDDEKVLDWKNKPLRNFTFLPRYIATRPPAWLLEYWCRSDDRLAYRDIKARMTAPPRSLPNDNTLNMRREREARGPLGLSCWNRRRGTVTRIELERIERWSIDQLTYNTVMRIEYDDEYQPVHLRKRAFNVDRNGSTIFGQPTFPMNTFLLSNPMNNRTMCQIPGDRTKEAVSLFNEMSSRARELKRSSWQVLPDTDLPLGWRAIDVLNRYTYSYYKILG